MREFVLDPGLEEYSTERQWEIMQAWDEHGTSRLAAEALGINRSKVVAAHKRAKARAAKQGYAPEYGFIHQLPDGQKLRGVSTYYDKEGVIRGQWVKSQEDRERQAQMMREMVASFASELPRAAPVPAPEQLGPAHLMACYPIGDPHIGMLAWDEETGANYDMKIAEKLFMGAIDYLIDTAPPCDEATVISLGDFFHYDSYEAVTPASRNQLDADSRYPKMIRAGVRIMRYYIARALIHHQRVNVIIEIGNHDPSTSIFFAECLANVYEDEPRVTVDNSPAHFHYFTFGKNLVGIHHGHGAKMAELPMIMAADRPQEWGRSQFRYWWTGHVHHDQVKDYHGTKIESFRVLAAPDAWAAQSGYRAVRDMKCIVLHKEHGEVGRFTVNPDMLKGVKA
tara:strand:- start:2779 stop:3963 length:1185 start_codon:yes stop_codon:yes gene_type:complete